MLEGKAIHRVVFHEITERAIKEAIAKPRAVSMDLVNAQQARRALDYLVGFNLSPLLWKKIKSGLSAGRVQSPALRLIAEREAEIENSRRENTGPSKPTSAPKSRVRGKVVRAGWRQGQAITVTDEKQAAQIREKLLAAADGELVIEKVDKNSANVIQLRHS